MKQADGAARRILVTGGAGYLGGCMAHALTAAGMHPVVLDNFSTSARPRQFPFECHEIDLADERALSALWKKLGTIEGVIHFAARALVPESCQSPELYFRNNTLATLNTAQLCVEHGVRAFIHSSSCAIYGTPERVPITEEARQAPISPYGEAKRISEQMLDQFARYKPLRVVNLRYFNPAGSIGDGVWGENHHPETHLLPNVIAAALRGEAVSIFGDQYDTPDGTCVRDFIHVEDLMAAHLAALRYVARPDAPASSAINIGSGNGYSVKQVIAAVEKVLGKPIRVEVRPPRPGDPPRLLADVTRSRNLLQWAPTRDMEAMVRSHLSWEKKRSG